MLDVYIKYGMMIVAIAIIIALITFASHSLNRTSFTGGKEELSFRGTAGEADYRISQICDSCVQNKNFNRDCAILKLSLTSGTLNAGLLSLNKGEYTLKISNQNNKCVVRKIG